MNLLDFRKNIYTQNGEDGIVEKIFEVIGGGKETCCEFGAWDGSHLSNTRNLILKGWRAVLIEGDRDRYRDLVTNYRDNPKAHCLNCFVDTGENRLENLLNRFGVVDLDFLSIDIDGLDYEIFRALQIRPRVICVESSCVLDPRRSDLIDRTWASQNVGQSLGVFSTVATAKGYGLVCFNGNAFYVRNDLMGPFELLSDESAYDQYVNQDLSFENRKYLYLMNLGLLPPYYKHNNSLLTRRRLGIRLPGLLNDLVTGWYNRIGHGVRTTIRQRKSKTRTVENSRHSN